MMTRKHFKAIAKIFADNRAVSNHHDENFEQEKWEDMRDDMIRYLKTQSRGFKSERFKDACDGV